MSKFKPELKLIDVEYVDYPGLEIRTRSASIAEIKAAQELNIDINKKGADDLEKMEAFTFFQRKLVKWNMAHPEVSSAVDDDATVCAFCGLHEDDEMPTTVASMMCLDFGMMMAIIFGWIKTIATVSLPKGSRNSSTGGTSGLGDVPMDGMEEEIMRRLEELQLPTRLPTPNFS
jgi:hypothetical protein